MIKSVSKIIYTTLVVGLSLGLVSCGDDPQPTDPSSPPAAVENQSQMTWDWQARALTLQINADNDLNEYNFHPHALMVCMYQLKVSTNFNKLQATNAGIDTLLHCEPFDDSVVGSERIFVQPGEQINKQFDRIKSASFVAFVAGYADSNATRVSTPIEFPVLHSTKGYFMWKKQQYTPGKLHINIKLGKNVFGITSNPIEAADNEDD